MKGLAGALGPTVWNEMRDNGSKVLDASKENTKWWKRPVKTASLVAQMIKNLPAMQETQVQFLGWKDPLEMGMAIHFSILAWRIPWTEEPGRLQSMGSPRVRHHWVTNTHTHTHTHTHTPVRRAEMTCSSDDSAQRKYTISANLEPSLL